MIGIKVFCIIIFCSIFLGTSAAALPLLFPEKEAFVVALSFISFMALGTYLITKEVEKV